jgi:hypothetical protein
MIRLLIADKRQELLTHRDLLGSHPCFLLGSVLLIILVICVVFYALFVFVLSIAYPNVASVSKLSILDFSFGFL